MTLQANTRLGPYEVVTLLGVGGMGEVYRARDTRLDRDVAIKILPAAVADHPARRERFAREARSISQLSHPNICTIHDVGEEAGIAFLVMEYIDGESLDKRLRLGPLPWATALEWAIQIADAIDVAHRRGIVHRDLKPANIMVADSGIKLLDFGLAKLLEDRDQANAGEPTKSITAEQKVLGTLHYMSPEQLEGRQVDARTDIFAFGVTLYEMVTGRKAFDGTSAASVSAAILASEPAPVSSAAGKSIVAPGLDHIIRRALAKHPDERWQTARDMMLELRWLRDGRPRITASSSARHRARRIAVAAGIAIAVLLAGVWGWRIGLRQQEPVNPLPIAMTITAPPNTVLGRGYGMMAVSPDGRKIVFVAGPERGTKTLWLQSLDSPTAHVLLGTEDGHAPFWSPDSQWIGFRSKGDKQLQRVSITGGAPLAIADLAPRWLDGQTGAFWSPDGTIVFAQPGGLFRVNATDGVPAVSLSVNGGMPRALPGGRWLYLVAHTRSDGGLKIQGPGLAAPIDVPVQSNAVFAAGHLLFRQGQALVAQPFDDRAGRLTSTPTTIAEDVSFNPANGRTLFDVSENLLAYRLGDPWTLTWRERDGRLRGSVGELRDMNPAIVPRGPLRVAMDRWDTSTNTYHVWTMDEQGRATQLTRGRRARWGTWSPDGKSLVYVFVSADGVDELRRQSPDGKGNEEVLLRQNRRLTPFDYSSDGRFLVYQPGADRSKPDQPGTPGDGDDLWALPLTGTDKQPQRITNTPSIEETSARLSPDVRWLAYSSNEGGQANIWVQDFPGGLSRRKISTSGGMDPSWRADGKELYYVALDGRLMAVPVTTGSTFASDTPKALFKFDPGSLTIPLHLYSATPDGKQFLVSETSRAPEAITVIVNWRSRLR